MATTGATAFGSAVAGATAGLDLADSTVVDSTAVLPDPLGTANPDFAKACLADRDCCSLAALAFASSLDFAGGSAFTLLLVLSFTHTYARCGIDVHDCT